MHVTIIGAGLAGLTSAWNLQKAGVRVTVIDRREGPGLETSFANAALMHPSLVDPWNSPGVGWDLLRWLGREDAPMLLHLAQIPGLSVWGLKFLANSMPSRHRANTLKNLRLALLSRREMTAIRAEASMPFCWERTGVLSISRSPDTFGAAQVSARHLAPLGINYRTLDRDETVAIEPALASVAREISGSIHFTDDERGDAYQFCTGLAAELAKRGVNFIYNTAVHALRRDNTIIKAVETSAGDLGADAFILAAGSFSTLLARPLDIDIPVRPAKGYSATLSCGGNPDAPRMPISDNGVHAAVTPLGDGRVRIAGTAEFAGYDMSIRQPRIDYLMRLLGMIYPKLARSARPDEFTCWAGLRPMSCDGVPTASRTRYANLYLNTGHGHIGWTTAAGTARIVCDLVTGEKPSLDLADYSIDRF